MSLYPDIVYASGPTYRNNANNVLLMPFTYNNGRLDLPTSSNYGASNMGNEGVSIRRIGTVEYAVNSIGTNLSNFIVNKQWDGYTIRGPITVASPGSVIRVQQLSSNYLSPSWDQKAFNVSPNAWNGANFVGQPTTFLFNKPIVIQATGSNATVPYNGPTCITFQTYWDNA